MKPLLTTENLFSSDKNNLSAVYQLYAKALTKNAAIACIDWIGKGDEESADQAAVTAMRDTFNHLEIDGRIVIGEGERDQAPMLYIGEKVGKGGLSIDIAVDPLEGTTICANAMANSISVLALSTKNGLLHAPDVYMDKIAIGPHLPLELVSLSESIHKNIKNLAKAKKCQPSNLNICILARPRHDELIAKTRETGARVSLITDGDVSAAIATAIRSTKIDMYVGIGGAPEGVLAAAALSCMGGQIEGRLLFNSEIEKSRGKKVGIEDFNKIYSISDMVRNDVIFCATGVTSGWLLQGVKKKLRSVETSHLIMHRSQSLISYIKDKDYL